MRKLQTLRARELRRNSTDAERALWRCLRERQLEGIKFRRQQPIGQYIVDFVSFEKRLIVELDGGQHAEQRRKDTARDFWLGAQGFQIVRFWNNDVLGNLEGVLEEIRKRIV